MTGKREQILLIVDGEARSREKIKKVLEGSFKIVEAADKEAALNCLSAYEDRIAVVVLSMTLPGMGSFSMLNMILREKEVWKFSVITTAANAQLEGKALELEQTISSLNPGYRMLYG